MTGIPMDGLLWAWRLDGEGGGKALSAGDLRDGAGRSGSAGHAVWVHLHLSEPAARDLAGASGLGLSPPVVEALFADETRPRTHALDDGLLVNLRGVNLNPDSAPDDMVSVRVWMEKGRIVTVRLRGVVAVREVADRLVAGTGPAHAAGVLAEIARGLERKVQPVLDARKDALDAFEEQADDEDAAAALRRPLAALRAEGVGLARYLRPQVQAVRDVLEEAEWLPPDAHDTLAGAADRFLRQVEDLDALRDQAQVLQDRLGAALAERMGRTTYMLSLIAGIFLPLSFLTGLLGINVGGIPLADSPQGFAIVCAVLAGVTVFEVWLFRRLKWV